jgi:hypothetical protein
MALQDGPLVAEDVEGMVECQSHLSLESLRRRQLSNFVALCSLARSPDLAERLS